ncbi:DHA2 family efflux MFS transporter permease subunit [Bifidobacterium sp.]|jgi:EmrB/QacA subfamily drug resistance transporter|uniref:DHA2 family efflux MFS transporter permease subunit n=1 Tax=Bifidobacterium sp. TaxID=41200 RepID=UPI0025BF3B9A|nr:DHA2 family efflux MFS transporter permease subunit [Bifidobacterium sp.]MCI1634673.1 DHA2 family efflux MFS transporter permease subunit [Bifidobacterium sp.]
MSIENSTRRNLIFAVMLAASIAGGFAQTSLTTALPSVMHDLNINAVLGNWLTSGFSLAMAIIVPATAFMMKRFHTKALFITGIAIFTIGLFMAAVAPTFNVLMLARVIQAIGCGISLSMTQVIILAIFPISSQGTAMGVYGLAVGAAPVIAPTLTGLIVDSLGWRPIFWISAIISSLVLLLAIFVMDNVLENQAIHMDITSFLLCGFGFAGMQLGLSNLGTSAFFSPEVIGTFILSAMSLLAFVMRQKRLQEPFLNLRLFRNRSFSMAVALICILYAIMIAGSTIIPIYLQQMRGFPVTESALMMLPGSLVMAAITPLAGRLFDNIGPKPLTIVGMTALVISSVGFSLLTDSTNPLYVIIIFTIRLIAVGLMMMPITTWGIASVEQRYTSDASALLTSLRTLAGAFGSAIFVAVMVGAASLPTLHSLDIPIPHSIAGLDISFAGMTALSVIGLILAIIAFRKPKLATTKVDEVAKR